jgi:hypothetical protein
MGTLNRNYRPALGALALAAVAGCGGNNASTPPPAPPDMTALPPDLILADLKDNDYPSGPYAQSGGVNMGDVLPDFTFQGYFSPNTTMGRASSKTFGEVTMGMLHDSGARYAIINLSAFW